MHSYILANFSDQKKLNQKIISLVNLDINLDKWSSYPDIHILVPTINKNTVNKTQSIKIQDIRNLQSKLSLKPINFSFNLAIIQDAHSLTLAAQNSFLKLLEETPNSYIFLITNNTNAFIPTIKSRCQIIIDNSNVKFEIDPKFQQEFEIFQSSSPITRLKLIEKYQKSLSDSKQLLMQFIHIARSLAKKSSPKQSNLTLLKNLDTAYQDLDRNINRKLALDQLCLNWNEKLTF